MLNTFYGEGLGILLDKAAEGSIQMFAHFAELLEHYLYDPNSPARNYERYIAALRHLVDSPHVGDIYKIRPKSQLEMALKNRPDDPAADFGYALTNGTHGSLYAVRAEYTLLVFYDPDCPGYREVTARMAASRLLRSWTADRRKLSVLAVYPGKDTALWRRRKKELPDDWIVYHDSPRQLSTRPPLRPAGVPHAVSARQSEAGGAERCNVRDSGEVAGTTRHLISLLIPQK